MGEATEVALDPRDRRLERDNDRGGLGELGTMSGHVDAEQESLRPSSQVERFIFTETQVIDESGIVGDPIVVASRSATVGEWWPWQRDHLAIGEAVSEHASDAHVLRPDVKVDERWPVARTSGVDRLKGWQTARWPDPAQRSLTVNAMCGTVRQAIGQALCAPRSRSTLLGTEPPAHAGSSRQRSDRLTQVGGRQPEQRGRPSLGRSSEVRWRKRGLMSSEIERTISAAQSPGWGVGEGSAGEIMATADSGQIGMPHVVIARRGGRGMSVSLYQPGDDITIEGEVIGTLAGNPRDMGRQLRTILEDLELDTSS